VLTAKRIQINPTDPSYFDHHNMPLTIPPELKKITPYVRRAEELDKDKTNAESRLVAYYCRQYAVQQGISLAKSVTGKTCLGELLNALEQEKEAMNQFTKAEAKYLCKMFANKIFDKADGEDRAGEATKVTARTFYAAASFLEILMQFYKNDGEDDAEAEEVEEIKKRAVYGKWKATEILKAFNEGRRPTPGGYGEDEPPEDDDDDDDDDDANNRGAASTTTNLPPASTPTTTVPSRPTLSTVQDDDDDDDESQSEPDGPVVRMPPAEDDDDDAEVLPPPPAYNFVPPPVPPPVASPPSVPTEPVVSPTKKGGIFGGFGGNKKKTNLSKAEYADAVELTKFAMAAMEDKNSDLAAERLAQAMNILNRDK